MRVIVMIVFCLLFFLPANSQQTVDTIRTGNLDMRYLPLGDQQFLVYLVKDNQKIGIWTWKRITTKESWKGQPSVVIRQQWNSSDTGYNSRQLFSVVNANTFIPVYHSTYNAKGGKAAFDFTSVAITAADSADSRYKDFKQVLTEPCFNWELDLETFPLLPLKKGKTFAINFYHPGGRIGPKWYNYSVIGSEKLNTVNGKKIDCYKLYTAYENNQGSSTWWLSKKTHEVIKMEEHYGSIIRYKIKLAVSE